MDKIEQLARVALVAVNELRTALKNFKGDFGDLDNDIDEWRTDLFDIEVLIEHIAEVTA